MTSSIVLGIVFWGMYNIDTNLVLAPGTTGNDSPPFWDRVLVHGGTALFLLFHLIFSKITVAHTLLWDAIHMLLVIAIFIISQLIHIQIYGQSCYGFQRGKSVLHNAIIYISIYTFIFLVNIIVRMGLNGREKLGKIKSKKA